MFHELDRHGKCMSTTAPAPAMPLTVGHCAVTPVSINSGHSRDHHHLVVNSRQRSMRRHDMPGAW
jgi:hypothetical protein